MRLISGVSRRLVQTSALLLLLSGCGRSDVDFPVTLVTGTVTYKGQPLNSGTITFVPDDESLRGASGLIDDSGYYLLKTSQSVEGIMPGRYKVRLESWTREPTMKRAGERAIPSKYENLKLSGLTAVVEPDVEEQTVDFALSD